MTGRTIAWAAGAAVLVATAAMAQQRGPIEDSVDCVIEAKETAKLGSAETGIITEVVVDRGDIVSKGQIVARLDSRLQDLAVHMAKLKAESSVDLRSAQTRLTFRSSDARRAETLHERQALPEKKLDEANVEKDLAALSLQTAQHDRRVAEVELAHARERLERRVVRSPFDGVVAERYVSPGEYVHEQVSLMRIAGLDPLQVKVFTPISYYRRISIGSTADVTLEEPIGGTYRAVVTMIDKVFDPASRTFTVQLDLANPDYHLPAGLICSIRFHTDATRSAAGVPGARPRSQDAGQ